MRKKVAVLLILLLVAWNLPAAIDGNLKKRSYEQIDCSYDFSNALGNHTITLAGVTATDRNGASATSTIIAASPAPAVIPATNKIGFRVIAGSNGMVYTVFVNVTVVETGEKFQGQINVTVGDSIQ